MKPMELYLVNNPPKQKAIDIIADFPYFYVAKHLKCMTNLKEKFEVTQAFLLEHFDYRDGYLFWKKSYNNSIIIGTRLGCIHTHIKDGEKRYKGKIRGRLFLISRLIFLYHKNYLPETVDHIDRNSLNDRIENLRGASRIENARNKSSAKNSSSQYVGVSFEKCKAKWTCKDGEIKTYMYYKWAANIFINGNHKKIGRFDTQEAAALAYNRMAVMHFKEFANLNIIKP